MHKSQRKEAGMQAERDKDTSNYEWKKTPKSFKGSVSKRINSS